MSRDMICCRVSTQNLDTDLVFIFWYFVGYFNERR